jgi:hypothetical protein
MPGFVTERDRRLPHLLEQRDQCRDDAGASELNGTAPGVVRVDRHKRDLAVK